MRKCNELTFNRNEVSHIWVDSISVSFEISCVLLCPHMHRKIGRIISSNCLTVSHYLYICLKLSYAMWSGSHRNSNIEQNYLSGLVQIITSNRFANSFDDDNTICPELNVKCRFIYWICKLNVEFSPCKVTFKDNNSIVLVWSNVVYYSLHQ